MQEISVRYALPCSGSTYWRCVFDDEYNRRYYYDVLKYRRFDAVSLEERAGIVHREFFLDPSPARLAGPLAKLAGALAWTEVAEYDPASRRMKLRFITNLWRERLDVRGEMWCDDQHEGTTLQAQFRVKLSVPVLGPLVEPLLVQELQRSFDKLADFTREFVNEKGWSPSSTELGSAASAALV